MRRLGMMTVGVALVGLLSGCSNSPATPASQSTSSTSSTATTTPTTAATTTSTTAVPAPAPTPTSTTTNGNFTAAKQQWTQGACAASAVQGSYWQAAATDLQNADPSTYAADIADLKQLITLPDMGLTATQSTEYQSDIAALDGLFGTPGLYGTASGNC